MITILFYIHIQTLEKSFQQNTSRVAMDNQYPSPDIQVALILGMKMIIQTITM